MQAVCKPGSLNGIVKIPASKSMMQRVCALALLNNGKTTIHNPGISNDDKTALSIISQLGADVKHHNDTIEIISKGIAPKTEVLNCGESGLSARLFIPIAAMCSSGMRITGEGSLLNRPFDVYAQILPELGVQLITTDRHLPFTIKGPLVPQDITIDGSVSSQFLSGLLISFAYYAKEPCSITVKNLQSRPYIDLTLSVLKKFGHHVTHELYQRFYIDPKQFNDVGDVEVKIEGDWSSAAAIMVAAAINGNVELQGLNVDTSQADKAILNLLQSVGAGIDIGDENIKIKTAEVLKPFMFDATHSPDLFPVLSILAAYCDGESEIRGLHRLIHKESNRIESITDMLERFMVNYYVEDDALFIQGRSELDGAIVDSYNDHRIVMAAAIGALRANNIVTIQNAEAISKSYPDFFRDLQLLGGRYQLKD